MSFNREYTMPCFGGVKRPAAMNLEELRWLSNRAWRHFLSSTWNDPDRQSYHSDYEAAERLISKKMEQSP